MTITSTPPTAPADPGHRRAGAALEAAVRRFLAAFGAARGQRHLRHLTDHMLRDVGLMRDQIMRFPAGRRCDRLTLLQG